MQTLHYLERQLTLFEISSRQRSHGSARMMSENVLRLRMNISAGLSNDLPELGLSNYVSARTGQASENFSGTTSQTRPLSCL
jgi:hypothetical protein